MKIIEMLHKKPIIITAGQQFQQNHQLPQMVQQGYGGLNIQLLILPKPITRD